MNELIQNQLDVAVVAHWLNGRTIEDAKALFDELSSTVMTGWAGRALCALHIVETAGHGERGLESAAELLGVSRGHVWKLTQAAKVIREKLARDGEDATFPLPETAWYQLAAQVASEDKPAVEYLGEAEQRREEDPKFSPSKWRKELGLTPGGDDEGSTTSDERAVWRVINKLAKFEDDDLDDAATHVDNARAKLVAVQDALSAVDRLRVKLQEVVG